MSDSNDLKLSNQTALTPHVAGVSRYRGPASVLSSDDLTDFGVEWFKGTPSTAQRFTLRITRSLHREAVALLLMPIPVAC